MNNSNQAPKAKTTASKQKRKTRAELNAEGRERKREKKHRGRVSGSRTNVESDKKSGNGQRKVADPRIGSKFPIPLIVDEPKKAQKISAKKEPNAELKEKAPKLSPEQELDKLEQDARLDALLVRLEEGEALSKEEQNYVDNTLDRIDELMEQLGIALEDDEDDGEEKEEDMMQLLRRGNPKDDF